MPTLEHGSLVEMFRRNPDIAPHFIETLFGLQVPAYASIGVVESTLDQMIPVEFRADLVLELRSVAGALVLAIVLEVQRDDDDDKKYTWPVYVSVVRARKRCPTVVLVVAPDAEVASWAAQPIDLGLGLGTVRPLVIGASSVPEVVDPAVAENEVELAVLSALAHGNGPNGAAVLEATQTGLERLAEVDREHAAAYFQMIYTMLREPMRRALEALVMQQQMENKTTWIPFIQRFIDEGELKGLREGELKGLREGELKGLREGELKGLREGELKGLREGELKGLREGELKGKREALLRLIARAGVPLGEGDRARILACTDGATLDRWLDNVLGAKSGADILS